MVQLYDEALLDYLSSHFSAEVSIIPVSDYWRVIAMHKEGRLSLPALCLSRSNNTPDREMGAWVIGRKGRTDRIQNHRRITEQALPITLEYNITVLTTTQDDLDELTSEVMFLLINSPRISIKIPYGSERKINAQIYVRGEVQDSSLRDTFSVTGILYQSIVPVRLLGANIFNIEERNLRYLKWSIGPLENTKEENDNAEN